jgi:hypothetical protein
MQKPNFFASELVLALDRDRTNVQNYFLKSAAKQDRIFIREVYLNGSVKAHFTSQKLVLVTKKPVAKTTRAALGIVPDSHIHF